MSASEQPTQTVSWWWTVLIAVALALPLLGTLEDPGMVWDEGYTVDRVEKVQAWFGRWLGGHGRLALLDAESIDRHWPFAREEPDGHPPLYAIVALVGAALAGGMLPPLAAFRVGAVLLFVVTLLCVHRFLARRVGLFGASAAVLLCGFCPRLFAHAHFALYDVPLACWWLLAAMAFWKAREAAQESWGAAAFWASVTALAIAAAAATKFTGWLIPLPLLAATWLFWPRAPEAAPRASSAGWLGYGPVLLLITALPLLVAVPSVVQLWHKLEAIDQEVRAEHADLTPAQQRFLPRLTAARYRQHCPSGHPGWALLGAGPLLAGFALLRARLERPGQGGFQAWEFWAVLVGVAPAATLLLVPPWWPDPLQRITLFLWSNLTRSRTTWIPTQFLGQVYEFGLPWYNTILWLVFALPPVTLLLALGGLLWAAVPVAWGNGKPRQLLRYFAVNAAVLLIVRALPTAPGHDGIRQLIPSVVLVCLMAGIALCCLPRGIARVIGSLAVGWSVMATAWYHPVQLSYYSELVGGLPGAAALGMEPTYYWDALDERTRQWLVTHTAPDEKVAFSSLPLSFHYLRRWGYLPLRFLPDEPGRLRWYVLQNRPGMFLARPLDRALAERGRAAYERRCLGVPLIWVFSADELRRFEER